MKNNLEQLKEIIIKAVPEIMECFDCAGYGFYGDDNRDTCGVCLGTKKGEPRSITLEDVLVALSKNEFFKTNNSKSILIELINFKWQLLKPLNLQSPELVIFLLGILNKNI